MYYFYGLLILAVQVYFAIHAYRTGREWWILIILLVPVAGALVYLFAVWLPDFERQMERRDYRTRPWSSPPPRTARSRPAESERATATEPDAPAQKLKLLKQMLDDDLITEADYEAKKAEILAEM